ncbi:hypothetical protein QYF36_002191 [Acer negundo]|nr:hypothetical protein QYF36_002191 [Acer negundo]
MGSQSHHHLRKNLTTSHNPFSKLGMKLPPSLLTKRLSREDLSSRELDEMLDWVQDVFRDGEEDEEEETEEKVKEVEDVPFEEPLLYKKLKPYVSPITLPSQPE